MEIEISGIESLFVLLLFGVAALGMLLIAFEPKLYGNPLSPKLKRLGWTIRKIPVNIAFDSLYAGASQSKTLEFAAVNLDCFAFSIVSNDGNLVRGFATRAMNGSRLRIKYPLGFVLLFGSLCALAGSFALLSGEFSSLFFVIPFLSIVSGILGTFYLAARQEAQQAIEYLLASVDTKTSVQAVDQST